MRLGWCGIWAVVAVVAFPQLVAGEEPWAARFGAAIDAAVVADMTKQGAVGRAVGMIDRGEVAPP
jgi:hypothetical protein